MISAEEFIDILEAKDLLEPDLVEDLRRRIGQSMAPVSAALLAKRLVDKGHLSRKLAQRLLDRAESAEEDDPLEPEPADERVDAGNLGLAPLEEDEDDEIVEELPELEMTEEEDWGLQELEEDRPSEPPPAVPVRSATPIPAATPLPPAAPPQPIAPAPPASSLVSGLEIVDEIDGLEALDEGGEPEGSPLAGPRSGRRGQRTKGKKADKRNVWDSALLLIGGGVLLFLIIVGIVLWFVLSGRGADDMIAQAHDYYAQGSYTKAEDSYSQFLEKFPKHPDAGLARVKLSLTRMRQVIGSDWPTALEVAKTEIPLMSGEETFATEARPELASMLPDIAGGLAEKAHANQDAKMADLAEEAVAFVEKYVPSSSRPNDRMQDIEALIELTRREIARSERLAATVDEIMKAAEEGRTQDGYQLRRDLLKDYNILVDDPTLTDAIRIVSKAEQGAVKTVKKTVEAVNDEPSSSAVATIGLAQRSVKSPVAGVGESRVFAVAGGAVYGLEAGEGRVLWRRDVGFEENIRSPKFPPTPISDKPGADPLLVSRARQEVLRVDASTGKIRWRFPVGEPFDAHPVVFEQRVLVATAAGRLVSLDLETGNSAEYIQLPQPLRVGPSADQRKNLIYQIGDHSSLFVLSSVDGTCTNVVYLGHEPGSIIVPPVRLSRYLVVCENDQVNDSVVKVLDTEPTPSEGGEPASIPVVQEIRLKGHVYTAPVVNGPQVLLVTDAGSIRVFGLTGTDGKDPLSLAAEGNSASEDRRDLVRFAALTQGRFWIADDLLIQYAVRSSAGRLKPAWTANVGSISMQPPVLAGDAVIHVAQRRGVPGVVVSAVSVTQDGAVLWETKLASPAAGTPVVDINTRTLIATTAVGGVFQVEPPADGQVALRDDPTRTVPSSELSAPVSEVVRLPDGLIAMIPGGDPIDLPVFEPGKSPDQARIRPLALSSPLAGRPVAFGGGLLVPCADGQVSLLDARTGSKLAEPFQPELEAGRKYRWSRPAVIGNDQFVIANDSGGLYRAVINAEPTKHFAAAASLQLDDPLTSPLAVLGNRVYGVDRTDALVRADLPGLTDKTQQALGAKCVMGPVAIGDYVILVTNDDLMHVIDSSGKIRADNLPYGAPTSEPAVDGQHWLFASASGTVWRVDPATGEELGKSETGLALGSGLAVFGKRLLVAGHDGTLYLIEKP